MNVIMQLQNLLTITFVVSSMLGMGMGLTPRKILRPLRKIRRLIFPLVASFVIVPAAAFLLARIPADPDLQVGILILGACAGAPFLLKFADIARANVPFAVGLLVLLVLATSIYLPVVLPFLIGGDVEVDALAILGQLSLQLILPLGIGLFAHSRYPEETKRTRPAVIAIANVSLILLIGLMLTANAPTILAMFGTGAISAIIALIGIGMLSGWLLGGRRRANRATVALATGHRNYAAAFVLANGSFVDRPNVFAFLAAAAAINMVMSFAFAGELRRRYDKRIERARKAETARRGEAPA